MAVDDLNKHSFKMVNLGQQHRINDKFIYPEVKVLLEVGNEKYNNLKLESYLRLKYRGKYYLCKCYRESDIAVGISEMIDVITELKHFYSEIYKYQKLMKVDLKMIYPSVHSMIPKKRVFELDPDQTPEEKRLRPEDL